MVSDWLTASVDRRYSSRYYRVPFPGSERLA